MARTAREVFEATVSGGALTRNDEGYLDSCVNRDWRIWQLAWAAAYCELCHSKNSLMSRCELDQEEMEFIKSIFK